MSIEDRLAFVIRWLPAALDHSVRIVIAATEDHEERCGCQGENCRLGYEIAQARSAVVGWDKDLPKARCHW